MSSLFVTLCRCISTSVSKMKLKMPDLVGHDG